MLWEIVNSEALPDKLIYFLSENLHMGQQTKFSDHFITELINLRLYLQGPSDVCGESSSWDFSCDLIPLNPK